MAVLEFTCGVSPAEYRKLKEIVAKEEAERQAKGVEDADIDWSQYVKTGQGSSADLDG